jgi:3-dehydroquinate dehydratase type I
MLGCDRVMKNYTLCSCLTETTLKNCLDIIKKIDTELIEHRIDYLEDKNINYTNLKELYSLAHKNNQKVIATCRNKNCKGGFGGSEEERISVLIDAIKNGADFVDIEVETQEKLKRKVVDFAKKNNCKVIVSMHDFVSTPNNSVLLKVVEQEINDGADIGKIVTFANNKTSCIRVLDLILKASEKKFPLVAFCMGEKGKSSRLTCLALGSPFTFVSFNTASAPGQFTKEEVEKLLKIKTI